VRSADGRISQPWPRGLADEAPFVSLSAPTFGARRDSDDLRQPAGLCHTLSPAGPEMSTLLQGLGEHEGLTGESRSRLAERCSAVRADRLTCGDVFNSTIRVAASCVAESDARFIDRLVGLTWQAYRPHVWPRSGFDAAAPAAPALSSTTG
jgi:hypothetical protein